MKDEKVIEGNIDIINEATELRRHGCIVNGYFSCASTNITSLSGSPAHVNGSFYCHQTKIKSLEGAPSYVGGDFICYNTKIISLQNIHKQVKHIGGVIDIPVTTESHILGIMFIKGLKGVAFDGHHGFVYAPYIPVTTVQGGSGGSSSSGAGGVVTVFGGPGHSGVSGPSVPNKVFSGTISFETPQPTKLKQAVAIINKHLQGDRDVHACQEEMLEADLVEFAKL